MKFALVMSNHPQRIAISVGELRSNTGKSVTSTSIHDGVEPTDAGGAPGVTTTRTPQSGTS